MPNHITNVLKFNCSDERFEEITKFLQGDLEEGAVDFNTIIPMPKALDISSGSVGERGFTAYKRFLNEAKGKSASEAMAIRKRIVDEVGDESWKLGIQYYKNFMLYGAPTWYEWCNANWGTKWNAYDCWVENSHHEIGFNTAWSGVPEIVNRIASIFPDCGLVYKYADEDFGYNIGVFEYDDGELVSEYYPEGGSDEALELASEINGLPLEEMGYVQNEDGHWEYHDDWDEEEEEE